LARQIAEKRTNQGVGVAKDVVGEVQRRMGEDYYRILEGNPIISETMSRSTLITENDVLLKTTFNVPWITTLMWSAAAGSVVALDGPIAKLSGEFAHYGPGHVKVWDEVNRFMDSQSGRGHRLKFGHSIEYLPRIIEKFGIEGVPVYFAHLIQDFATKDGIPILPNAWELKKWLQIKGLSAKAATGALSISFSKVLAALSVITLVSTLWRFGDIAITRLKVRNHLAVATKAIEHRDFNAAAQNYKRVLEMQRSPAVLMALGQTYMQRESTRLAAHQVFNEALDRLSDRPHSTVPYGAAQLSLRGLAGVHALATSDVLSGIHPDHWNEHVENLVNATVFSFTRTAEGLDGGGLVPIPQLMSTPANFSAAINYYLAAMTASYYPLHETRRDVISKNLNAALGLLGLVAQYDEDRLRNPIEKIRRLWTMELLPIDEVPSTLERY